MSTPDVVRVLKVRSGTLLPQMPRRYVAKKSGDMAGARRRRRVDLPSRKTIKVDEP